MIFSAFAFLIAIAILILVHEFGHFWVARCFGVKVLRFSIGFGKPLFRWNDKKGTEYVIAMFPLGGYVKMLDETEDKVKFEERDQAFNRKPLYARMAVVLAGPLFNLLFAVVAYWLMFVIGITTIAPVIGKVIPNSIAAKAGLKPSYEITAIGRRATHNWQDVHLGLMAKAGKKAKVPMMLKKVDSGQSIQVKMDLHNLQGHTNLLKSLGVEPFVPYTPPIVGKIVADYPAAEAGLLVGDKVLSVDDTSVKSWQDFVEYIKERPEHLLKIKIDREGQQYALELIPMQKTGRDEQYYGFIGASSQAIDWPENMLRTLHYSMLKAWLPALKETGLLIHLTFKIFWKLFTGGIPLSSISGPIGIAQGAGLSAQFGFTYFLGFLGLVSVSLGVLNLLPIPILDGGHLLFYLIEMIRRRPLSDIVQQRAIKAGLFFLVCIMVFAMYNDIIRLTQ